jgi:hypothetical protein
MSDGFMVHAYTQFWLHGNQSMALPLAIFMKLTSGQQQCMQISYTELNPKK